jgi:hypothetical protein
MIYDAEQQLFYLGAQADAGDAEVVLQHAVEVSTKKLNAETLILVQELFPEQLLYPVKADGTPDIPVRCPISGDGQPCKIVSWAREPLSNPVLTPHGPVFLRPVRWTCRTHGHDQTAGSKGTLSDLSDPFQMSVPHYRMKNVRVSPDFIMVLC